MTMFAVLNEVRAKGIKVWHENGELKAKSPKGVLTPELRERLTMNKAEIIAFLSQGGGSRDIPAIEPVDRSSLSILPLSYSQERLWFIDQLDPESAGYNCPGAVKIRGELDVALLEKAIRMIIDRHEVLRAVFSSKDGQARQTFKQDFSFTLNHIDLSESCADKTPEERDTLAQTVCRDEAAKPFNLSEGPLIRGTVISLDERAHILMLNLHHIVADGWSLGVMVQELSVIIASLRQGVEPNLPPLPIQYVDYAVWQRRWLEEGGELEKQLDYWENKLSGMQEVLDLATDYPRPSMQGFEGAIISFDLDEELTEKVKALGDQYGCTPFMTFLTIFKVLLHRYTNQDDICIGCPIANRHFGETEPLIGMFVNSLAIRSFVKGNESFSTLLNDVRINCLEAYQHQDAPFEKVVDRIQPQRNMAISPIFQIMFILQSAPPEGDITNAVEPYDIDIKVSQFDITLELSEKKRGFRAALEYRTDLYSEATMRRMKEHYRLLCQRVVENPDARLRDYDFLSESEKQQILDIFNDTTQDYPKDKCIHDLFVEQVSKTPDAIAVEFGQTLLSYQALYEKCYSLAVYLQSQGVKPDDIVGICVERNIDLVVGVMGTLMAGAAYVPLDPNYPEDRLRYMLNDCKARIVLTQSPLVDKLQGLSEDDIHLVSLDKGWENVDATLDTSVNSEHLAYVIYTSGSTGQPKGVMIEHQGAVNHCIEMINTFGMTEQDTLAQTAGISFDISVWQTVTALFIGAKVAVVSTEVTKDPQALFAAVNDHGITVLQIVPSLLRALTYFEENDLPVVEGLRWLSITGEAFPPDLCEWWLARYPKIPMMNAYGPAECSDDVTLYPIYKYEEILGTSIPIGKPIANTQIYVLDEHLYPMPVGMPGEIHVAGDGLARAYLNRPELSEEKFIANPFTPGQRMYKTGDVGRWLNNGSLEYLGRVDNQVKIRGFRIEIGEIETQLANHADVSNCAVVVQGVDHHQQLVAFYVCRDSESDRSDDKEASSVGLKEYLSEILPEHMIPVAFVKVDQIPLTPNGKVDRNKLKKIPVEISATSKYVAPETDVEKALVAIWSQVLNIEDSRIGIHDNFFELGGHSMLMIALISKMATEGYEFLAKEVMSMPTIAQLVSLYETNKADDVASVHEESDEIICLPNRHMLFNNIAFPNHWNTGVILALGDPNAEHIYQALRSLLLKHEGLRHKLYRDGNGVIHEEVFDIEEMTILEHIDCSDLTSSEEVSRKIETISNEYQFTMDLATCLHRFVLFNCGETEPARLLLLFHEILIDGYSIPIFIEEFAIGYLSRYFNMDMPEIPPPTSTIGQWSRKVYEYANSPASLQTELDYWDAQPWNETNRLYDFPDGYLKNTSDDKSQYGKDVVIEHYICPKASEYLLGEAFKSSAVSIAGVLLHAFSQVICRLTQSKVTHFEHFSTGREQYLRGVDVSRTIGHFVESTQVFLTQSDAENRFEQLRDCQKQMQALPASGLGFNAVKQLCSDASIRDKFRNFRTAEFLINYIPPGQDTIESDQAVDIPDGVFKMASEHPGQMSSPEVGKIVLASHIEISIVEGVFLIKWIYRDNIYKRATVENALSEWEGEILKTVEFLQRRIANKINN